MIKKGENRSAYLLAGGAAILGAILMQQHVSRQIARPRLERDQESYRVLSAGRDLQAGTEIQSEDLMFLDVRMSCLPRHIFEAGKVEEAPPDGAPDPRADQIKMMLVGRRLAVDLKRDDLLLATDFEIGQEASLGGALSENQRAVSVTVDRSAVMGGLLLPNDRVDVLAFYRPSVQVQSARREAYDRVQVVLRDVTVLAVGGRLSRMAEGGRSGGGDSTVVLGLSPDEALTLSLVQRNAQISLLLRPEGAGTRAGEYQKPEIDMKDVGDVLRNLQPESKP